MRELQHTNDITETMAMEHILGACRANEKRVNKTTFGTYQVTFTMLLNEQFLARLYHNGGLIATAIVDQYDI